MKKLDLVVIAVLLSMVFVATYQMFEQLPSQAQIKQVLSVEK